ncbi:MAG: hypothetical protein K0R38_7215 [Polyangiaceae bacterium]|jgi:hypothetical protein|nr:hypothetical protein [Polyangiaceae bacterium]
MKNWTRLLGAVALLNGCADFDPAVEGEAERLDAQSQALSTTDVFGFEDLSQWTVAGGTKQAFSPASQGARALGVAGFHYTSIVSKPISQLSGVTSQLALDVRLPATAAWGDLRLIVRAPSKGIWYGDLGAKPLSALASGAYRTVTFDVPPAIRAALESQPSDFTLEIAVNAPGFSAPVAFDNVRFVGAVQSSVVEIRAPLVDDVAFLDVNGLRHSVGHWGQPSAEASAWRDVSRWFSNGKNQIRLLAVNTGGAQAFEFQLRLNGTTVVDINCETDGCETKPDGGVILDQVIDLPALTLAPARTVTVTSPVAGKLYVNDEYTGLTTPATLKLPAGAHRLGLGVSNDVPSALTGRFYEESVVVGGQNLSVTLGDEPALPTQYAARIAILPMRRARALDSGGLAVLTDAQIARFAGQFAATRDAWVKPLSYGLQTWNITLLPTEEQIDMVGTTFDSFPDHACEVLGTSKYGNLLSQYDVVMVHMSNYDEQQGFEIGRGSAGMGGRCGQIQAHWGAGLASNAPMPVILHELLHSYEFHNQSVLGLYNGFGGLHGAEVHGFQSDGSQGEREWVEWYRYFMRGQVAERADQSATVNLPAPVTNPDYYVGTFGSFRRGLWLAP